MRLLLDTNALIWTLAAPQMLSTRATEEIGDGSNEILVSVISAWEIGLKRAKGKLNLHGDLTRTLDEKSFQSLPLTLDHALAVESLPSVHHDPFDRMLVAQAQVEKLTLVTSDRMLHRYPIATMPA
ncbi:MAG: type II toxin-antitoxin system VapC family toxin [Chloroflexota bacterium]